MSQRGYFSPDSMIWRIGCESVLMLGGGRALLMQAAHPLVAAGIVAHSDYREHPWRRLARTMTALYTVVFGSKAEADRVAASVQAVHAGVRGRIPGRMGPYPAGTPYSAFDPDLALWVHATLVDTGLAMYRTYVAPLSDEEQEGFYRDMKVVARIFGVPAGLIPRTLDDFRTYERELLASGVLCVTDAARKVAEVVQNPPLPAPLRPALEAFRLITVGLLPAELREQYGFRWDLAHKALLAGSACGVRHLLLPLLPEHARLLASERRGKRPSLPLELLAAFASGDPPGAGRRAPRTAALQSMYGAGRPPDRR